MRPVKNLRQLLILIVAAASLSGCGDSYDNQVSRFESFVNLRKLGSSHDVWLEKFTFAGEWEKTALIFGYTDDFDACQNIISAWRTKYPLDTYRCTLAN